jgi:predicted DNA-binding transcriptional regulator AlpA
MGNNVNERWLSRQELADRYGLPVKTLAQWASKGTGPRYARMGRHVRYRLSDVIDWETKRVDDLRDATRRGAPTPHALEQIADANFPDANASSVRNER